MSMLNVKKLANALICNATPSDDAVPSIALWAVDRSKRKQGGLWVGGTVFVSELGVSFTPNSLNQTFHEECRWLTCRPKISERSDTSSAGLRAS